MAKLTPENAAAKWATRLGAATADIAAGVDRVTVAPGTLAARNVNGWLAKVTASKDKWARNVSRVSLQEWQDKMKNVGVPRIAQGATANQPKFAAFAAEFFPYLDQGVQRVRNMPKTNIEDGIARATAMIRHNAAFKRSGGQGS